MTTKIKQQTLIELLQKELDKTETMFYDKKVSHAYIIGYLQGLIKTTISELG
jgi:hypothetical protein